jgi:Hypervirulence associated proteins TUDOR domain
MVAKQLKCGDHVSWNSEAGRVRGKVTRIVTTTTQFKGYTVRASSDEPQYEIRSDKTNHIAMHKRVALRKLRK